MLSFSFFFSETVNELEILNVSDYKLDSTYNPLKEALKYFKNHPSVTNIKSKGSDTSFNFTDTSSSEAIKPIKTLNVKKFLKRLIFLLRLLS